MKQYSYFFWYSFLKRYICNVGLGSTVYYSRHNGDKMPSQDWHRSSKAQYTWIQKTTYSIASWYMMHSTWILFSNRFCYSWQQRSTEAIESGLRWKERPIKHSTTQFSFIYPAFHLVLLLHHVERYNILSWQLFKVVNNSGKRWPTLFLNGGFKYAIHFHHEIKKPSTLNMEQKTAQKLSKRKCRVYQSSTADLCRSVIEIQREMISKRYPIIAFDSGYSGPRKGSSAGLKELKATETITQA